MDWERSMSHRKVQQGVRLTWILIGVAAAAAAPPANAQQSLPVIDSVTFHENDEGRYPVVYPEFHFHDPSGTVRFIHREVIASNAPKSPSVKDGVIDISANRQIQGATYVGGWNCGPESYYVKLRAFVVNLDGGRSNTVEYTIHCNGG
jgi:hypothetical protein